MNESDDYDGSYKFWLYAATVVVVGLLLLIFVRAVGLAWRHDSAWVTAYSTALLAIASVISLVFIIRTAGQAAESLKDARKTRHGALITDLSRRWDERPIAKAFSLISEYSDRDLVALVDAVWAQGTNSAKPEQIRDYFILTALPNLFDTIGALYRDGAIDLDIVDRMWGLSIRDQWQIWGDAIEKMRGGSPKSTLYREFQDLNDALVLHRQKLEDAEPDGGDPAPS